jgi:hypothetical protein
MISMQLWRLTMSKENNAAVPATPTVPPATTPEPLKIDPSKLGPLHTGPWVAKTEYDPATGTNITKIIRDR